MASVLQNLRAKFSQYDDLSDQELAQRVLRQYPQYRDVLGGIAFGEIKRPKGFFGRVAERAAFPLKKPTTLGEGFRQAISPVTLPLAAIGEAAETTAEKLGVERPVTPFIRTPGGTPSFGVGELAEQAAIFSPALLRFAKRLTPPVRPKVRVRPVAPGAAQVELSKTGQLLKTAAEPVGLRTEKLAQDLTALNANARRIALEEAEIVKATGTIQKSSREAFREAPKPSTFDVRISQADIQRAQAELVETARQFKQVNAEIQAGGDAFARNAAKVADQTLDFAIKNFRRARFAAGRAVKQFDRPVPDDVIQALQEAGKMITGLRTARARLPIYNNIARGLREWKNLSDIEKSQFYRDLVDAWRLNLFSVTSFSLDMVGNSAELTAQLAGGIGRDIVHLGARGSLQFPSLQGFARAARTRLLNPGSPVTVPQVEQAFQRTTAGGEVIISSFTSKQGAFTTRETFAGGAIDYLVGTPLYFKGFVDTAAKRFGATASLWRDAIEKADKLKLRGLERRRFYESFFQSPPAEAIARAIGQGNRAGFNRELTRFEERVAGSVAVRLIGDVFARWPFQFSRTMAEWLGLNPQLFKSIRAGTATAEDIGEYLAKSASGFGGLALVDNIYDRIDFRSMEYVHPNGDRTRLSNRDPINTALFLLATIKGDAPRATASLRFASIPAARFIMGEGGLLGSMIRPLVSASRQGKLASQFLRREIIDSVNRAIPGQALLSALKTVFDPVVRDGVGANFPFASLYLPPAIERTTGLPLQPRQRFGPLALPTIGGTPIPGARRVLDPVFQLLSRYNLLIYRGPRSPIAGIPASELPREITREWEQRFGQFRQQFLLPLANQRADLELLDDEFVRGVIQQADANAARLATLELQAKQGGLPAVPKHPLRVRQGPRAFQRPTARQKALQEMLEELLQEGAPR